MATQTEILAVYTELETAARALVHGILLPEDVLTCCDVTARRLGIPVADVREAVRASAAGMWG